MMSEVHKLLYLYSRWSLMRLLRMGGNVGLGLHCEMILFVLFDDDDGDLSESR
jgi:hypothetical protein